MIRPPPRSTRTDTLLPYTTLFRSGGSYRIARLDADVTRVGATFAFTEHTMAGGLLCLSIQAGSIAEDGPVPVSPMHLVIHPNRWEIDVNSEAGTGVEGVTGGQFAERLISDGQTDRKRTRLNSSH